ncbi:MAG: hypothetical protein IH865_13505 [Chloroflexi bacterium]|nr:hypothetical protein [Chloroflexota bacterium]
MLKTSLRITIVMVLAVIGFGLASGAGLAQDGPGARSVPLQNFGWAPGFEGGSGSITYEGLNDPFEATVEVDDLLPNHEYGVTVMGVSVDGTNTGDDSSFTITTDGNGAGTTDVTLDLPTGEGVPAYQVHFLIVDRSQPLEEPLPNPLGVPFAVPLACEFPLGFRVAEAGSALPVEDDDEIALVNLGFAPDFEGGGGSLTWDGRGSSFEADVTATDLIPDHDYVLYVMAAGLDGTVTLDSTSYPVTTDSDGAVSSHVSLAPTAEGAPIPAFQVHILVVDETVTLEEPLPNPLGIAHPIPLACEFPAGFLGFPRGVAEPEPDLPSTGTGGSSGGGAIPLWALWLLVGAGSVILVSGAASVVLRDGRRV